MHPILNELCDAWGGKLSQRDTVWCQLHPLANDRVWNAQQLVGHLVLTYRSTCASLEDRLAKGRPTRAQITPVQRMMRITLFSLGFLPDGIEAPPATQPERLGWSPMSGVELAITLRQSLEMMDDALDRCQHQFGNQRLASHFYFGPMNVEHWRRFNAIHGWHHFKQLLNVERLLVRK